MLKLADNPPPIPPGITGVEALSGIWSIAHTKSRVEKAFAWDLINAKVNYFLPLVQRVTFSGGRKRRGLAPLFPSYVFLCGNEDQRQAAIRTNRLCRVIPVPDQARLARELRAVELALAGDAELDLYPFAAVGRRCRIMKGPMLGVEGIVVEKKQKARLVLQVSMIARGASLEVDLDFLEAVDDLDDSHVGVRRGASASLNRAGSSFDAVGNASRRVRV